MSKILFLKIPNHSLKYNPSIDGLRGIAIILVLLYHIWPKLFSFGYVGVDIFFVISGFLITQIIYKKIENKNFSFLEFYRNRIRRIFPVLIIVLTVAFAIGYFFMFPFELKELGRHIESSAFFYQNFRLSSEVGYWDESAQLKPLLHFWSLSIEEQFYIFWPLIILCLYKINKNIFISLFVVFIFLFSLPFFFEVDKFYNTLSRSFELAFGGLTFIFIYKYSFILNEILKFRYIFYILFFITIFVSYKNHEFNTFKTLMLVVSTGFLLICLYENPKKSFFTNFILVFIGLISYSLYLWHYVFISYGHIFGINVEKYGLIFIVFSIFASYLTYIFVEINKRKQESYKFAFILLIIVIFIGLFGNFISKSGLPDRSHLIDNSNFEKQFMRESAKNDNGLFLMEKVLGYVPNNDYIKSSSSDISRKYILITGDSHAHTSYPGFEIEFNKIGYETILLANSSCPPYIGGGVCIRIYKI